MPAWHKISHVSFSVGDIDVTAQWFEQVLGCKAFDEVEGDGWRGVMLIHPPSSTVLECQQHEANQGEAFDPRRTGLDHIGLKVGSRDELAEWQAHFKRLGVDFTPIADREYGSVLTFRDPDERQFEMFYRENHP